MFFNKKNQKDTDGIYVSAVIVAAGSSQRMGGENKLLLPIGGTPVLAHTIAAFDMAPSVSEIIVVCREQDVAEYGRLREQYGLQKLATITTGGDSRTASAKAGIAACNAHASHISIHDGARPFVSVEIIEKTIAAAIQYGAAAPAVPMKDSVKKVNENGFIMQDIARDTIVAAQTPQIFEKSMICSALEKAEQMGCTYTDECAAVEALGVAVYTTQGDYENIKITTQHDLRVGELINQERQEYGY